MDLHGYEERSPNGPDHRPQSENIATTMRRRDNTSHHESQDSGMAPNQLCPGDTVAFSREDLQSAEWALNYARMALTESRVPSSQPYPSVMIVFSREGLQSIDIALNNVRMALTDPPAPFQTRRDGSLKSEPDNSMEFHDDVSNSSPYVYGSHATVEPGSVQRPPLEPPVRRKVISSHDDSRVLLGIPATTHVNIEGTSVPLVHVQYTPRGYAPKVFGRPNKGFNGRATACLSQFPGFTFPRYDSQGLQEMAPFFDALSKHIPNARKMHRILYRNLPLIFREMLSQREVYTRVTDYATKRAFFFHIHQIHYSALVQYHNSLRNPRSRAKPNLKAEAWAGLEVDVLVKVTEAVILAREVFLQELAANRKAAATTQAGFHTQDQQGTEPGHSSMIKERSNGVEAGMGVISKLEQEPGLAGLDEDDLGCKPEPNGWDNVRLSDVPKFDGDNDDNCWLKNLDSEDEGNVSRPPPTGREHRLARRAAWIKMGELRTRNAVDRWIRFVRVELGR
ncbi:hypothetical protein VMCG_08062 [Cytospora schulzeri]|uniref:Uncharacterized protein n=1 Tax=Cytospora schulzeri TaxID=448051 RepID=A0A423VRC0_9PEZI|nr:hypothetical protein VMCG_08062 [Valsa malicola]